MQNLLSLSLSVNSVKIFINYALGQTRKPRREFIKGSAHPLTLPPTSVSGYTCVCVQTVSNLHALNI